MEFKKQAGKQTLRSKGPQLAQARLIPLARKTSGTKWSRLLGMWKICLAGSDVNMGVGIKQEGHYRQVVMAMWGFVDPTKSLNLI